MIKSFSRSISIIVLMLVFVFASFGSVSASPNNPGWDKVIDDHGVAGWACRLGTVPRHGFRFSARRNSANIQLVKVSLVYNTNYYLISKYTNWNRIERMSYDSGVGSRVIAFQTKVKNSNGSISWYYNSAVYNRLARCDTSD